MEKILAPAAFAARMQSKTSAVSPLWETAITSESFDKLSESKANSDAKTTFKSLAASFLNHALPTNEAWNDVPEATTKASLASSTPLAKSFKTSSSWKDRKSKRLNSSHSQN